MKAKKLDWVQQNNVVVAKFMGITLSVVPNNGKWDARLYNGSERPEIVSLDTQEHAKQYAENVLLNQEIRKWFDSGWVNADTPPPSNGNFYLVYTHKGRTTECRYYCDQWITSYCNNENVTHWQPLPPEPQIS